MPTKPRKSTPTPRPAKPAAAVNVAMVGDKVKVYSLQSLLTNKRNFKKREPSRLHEVLEPWFEKHVAKPGQKLAGVYDLWLQLLPPSIVENSRLITLTRGTLNVALPNAPARAQLDALLRQGLEQKLQLNSKGAIYRVKTSVDAQHFGKD